MSESLASIEDLLIIEPGGPHTPADTAFINARLAEWERPEVRQDRPYEVIKSLPTAEATVEELSRLVGPNTLVDVLAGDGTFSNVFIAASSLKRKVSLHTAGGGTARCIGKELADEQSRQEPGRIFSGRAYEHRPLLISAEHASLASDDKHRLVKAVAFFSLFFTAEMSARFNEPDFRQALAGKSRRERIRQQGLETNRHVDQAAVFKVSDNRGEHQVSDLVAQNGRYFAGFIRFRKTRLLAPGFGLTAVEGKLTRPKMLRAMLRAEMGRYDRMPSQGSYRFMVETPDEGPFYAEADGEAYTYPSGTQFIIDQIPDSVHLATTDRRSELYDFIQAAGNN